MLSGLLSSHEDGKYFSVPTCSSGTGIHVQMQSLFYLVRLDQLVP